VLIGIACSPRELLATSCSVPPPCSVVHPGVILFTGLVVGVVTDSNQAPNAEDASTEVRFAVDEIFEGLHANTKEAVVFTQGDWLRRGHSYLVDAGRSDGGQLYFRICGTSGEVTDQADDSLSEVLSYLHDRKAGKASTSLTVYVND